MKPPSRRATADFGPKDMIDPTTGKRLHYNIGLPQGFVRFGTVIERMLKLLLEHGIMCHYHFVEEGIEPRLVSTSLLNLERNGFIFRQGKISGYKLKESKTQERWALTPPEKLDKYRRASTKVRTQVYRSRKKMKAPSVFEFRGTISINPNHEKARS